MRVYEPSQTATIKVYSAAVKSDQPKIRVYEPPKAEANDPTACKTEIKVYEPKMPEHQTPRVVFFDNEGNVEKTTKTITFDSEKLSQRFEILPQTLKSYD